MTTHKRIFGTDGVRGTANLAPVDAETALKLGRAAAHVFKSLNTDARDFGKHKIVIARNNKVPEIGRVARIVMSPCDIINDWRSARSSPSPSTIPKISAAAGKSSLRMKYPSKPKNPIIQTSKRLLLTL